MAKQLDFSKKVSKEDCERGFSSETNQDLTMTAALKCIQAKTGLTKGKKVQHNTKFPFGRTRTFTLWKLWSTAKKYKVYVTFPKITDKHFNPTGVMVWSGVASDGSKFP